MKLTYIYPPLFKGFHPMATRLITENLLRNKDLQVEFSDIPVRTYSSRIANEIYSRLMGKAGVRFSDNERLFLEQQFTVYIIFYVLMSHGYFDEHLPLDIDSDYAVVTIINYCDLILVRRLLDAKKKVVVGGPLVNIGLSAPFIRKILEKMGVDGKALTDNLIVVSGNIDLSTDLHQIMRSWHDTTITKNDHGSIFDCERDFLHQFYDGSHVIPVHFGFNNRCWYGRCKFCTYKKLPVMDFISGIEESKIINYFHNIMAKFQSNQLRFVDSYFNTTSPRIQRILSEIQDYYITVYSGIRFLNNRNYIDFVNKNVDCLLIGLESTSDFSLNYINKGYTCEDIEKAVDNMVKHMDRKVFLELSVIMDLPCRDEDDVKVNYRRIAGIQDRLLDEGFNVGIHLNILGVIPNQELLHVGDGLLKRGMEPGDMKRSTGKNYMVSLLKEAGMENQSLLPNNELLLDEDNQHGLQYGYISYDVPVLRYDINGKLLPSDLHLIEKDVMEHILKRRRKRNVQESLASRN